MNQKGEFKPKEEPRADSPLLFSNAVASAPEWAESKAATTAELSDVKPNITSTLPKLVFDCVLLSRAKDIYVKLKEDIKPKLVIKKKEEKFEVPAHILESRLKNCKIYDAEAALRKAGLDPEIGRLAVHRRLLSQNFGGGLQETFTQPAPHFVAAHGITSKWVYPKLTVNPHAPTIPGHPGLFFSLNEMVQQRYYTVSGLGTNQWLFLGIYSLFESGPLSVAEWGNIPYPSQIAFAKHIVRDGWGKQMVQRVSLRKHLGRQLNEVDLQSIGANGRIMQTVNEQDIVDAISRGDEVIKVWGLECVEYDVSVARRVWELHDNGAWIMRSTKEQERFVADLQARMHSSQAVPPKAIRRRVRNTEAELEVESEVELETDEEDPTPMRRKRAASGNPTGARPHKRRAKE